MLAGAVVRSEEHTSELQSHEHLVCRLLLEKKKKTIYHRHELWVHQCMLSLNCVDCATHRRRSVASRHSSRLHTSVPFVLSVFFFFNDPAPPEIYPLPLPDALPI